MDNINDAEIIGSSPTPNQVQEVVSLSFFDAIREIQEGKKVTKLEWKDSNTFCVIANEHLSIHIDNQIKDWIVSLADIEGIDWVVVEESN